MEEAQDRGRQRALKQTPYRAWQKSEGIPVYAGAFVEDLYTLELGFWPRVGQQGAFVNLANQEQDDGWVIELAPGASTEPLHHLFESTIFVVTGRGATAIWQEGKLKQTVEWQRGTLFSPPLNCHYQHFNLDGQQPARLFAVTAAPMILNIYRNPEFVFTDSFPFNDRYHGEESFFSEAGYSVGTRQWKTNYVADVRRFELVPHTEGYRSIGGGSTYFEGFANNSMAAHISDFPPGTYKTAHRHGVGAHLVILDGRGYSLLWFEGKEEWRVKVDWKDGTVVSPRQTEYHQHFNTGPNAARYLALRLGDLDTRWQEWAGATASDAAE